MSIKLLLNSVQDVAMAQKTNQQTPLHTQKNDKPLYKYTDIAFDITVVFLDSEKQKSLLALVLAPQSALKFMGSLILPTV